MRKKSTLEREREREREREERERERERGSADGKRQVTQKDGESFHHA